MSEHVAKDHAEEANQQNPDRPLSEVSGVPVITDEITDESQIGQEVRDKGHSLKRKRAKKKMTDKEKKHIPKPTLLPLPDEDDSLHATMDLGGTTIPAVQNEENVETVLD